MIEVAEVQPNDCVKVRTQRGLWQCGRVTKPMVLGAWVGGTGLEPSEQWFLWADIELL